MSVVVTEQKSTQRLRSPALRNGSHQPEDDGLDDIEKDVRHDGRDVESTQNRNNAPQRLEKRLAQPVAPATQAEYGDIGSHELMTRTTIAAFRMVKVQLTSRW